MEQFYTIMINGQKAVDAGYKFCNGRCYRGIYTHGKRIAQLEVVVDDEGEYNGFPQKWVFVGYIKSGEDVKRTLEALKKIGFSGCPCAIDYEDWSDVTAPADTLCYLYI